MADLHSPKPKNDVYQFHENHPKAKFWLRWMMARPVNKLRVFVPSIAGRWGGAPNPEGGRVTNHPSIPAGGGAPTPPTRQSSQVQNTMLKVGSPGVGALSTDRRCRWWWCDPLLFYPVVQQPGSIIRVVVDRMTLCPQPLHLKIAAKTVKICMFRWMLVGFWCVLDPLGVGRMQV